MDREQAEDLVEDLLQALRDWENNSYRRSYLEDFNKLRERIITQLATSG